MRLQFSNRANDCYQKWKQLGNECSDALKRIIIGLLDNPFNEIGNPFPLEGEFKGKWAKEFASGLHIIYSISDELLRIEAISEPDANATVLVSDAERHKEAVELMRQFIDNGKPKLGIFWYDHKNNTLFGVEKGDAELYAGQGRLSTFPKLHKTYWQKMHHRAVAKSDTTSIFFREHDYTQIPMGRVFLEDGIYYVNVGDWINGYINGEKCIDADKVRQLVQDEFNLPDSFRFRQDVHWDIGHGWSDEQF